MRCYISLQAGNLSKGYTAEFLLMQLSLANVSIPCAMTTYLQIGITRSCSLLVGIVSLYYSFLH